MLEHKTRTPYLISTETVISQSPTAGLYKRLFKRYVHGTVFILQFARKSYPGPSQPKNNDLRSALFLLLTSQNMKLSARHLQNIKFSRIQAGDPQI